MKTKDIDVSSLPYLDNVHSMDRIAPLYRIRGSDCFLEVDTLTSSLSVLGPEGVWLQGPTLALRDTFYGSAMTAEVSHDIAEWIRRSVRKVDGLS